MARDGVAERRLAQALGQAGVEVGGSRPFDVTVHDERTSRRVALQGASRSGRWSSPRAAASQAGTLRSVELPESRP